MGAFRMASQTESQHICAEHLQKNREAKSRDSRPIRSRILRSYKISPRPEGLALRSCLSVGRRLGYGFHSERRTGRTARDRRFRSTWQHILQLGPDDLAHNVRLRRVANWHLTNGKWTQPSPSCGNSESR